MAGNTVTAVTVLVLTVLIAIVPPARADAPSSPVVVSSKIDTEGALLGTMILVLLDHNGIPTENRIELGPTTLVRSAILSGLIDIYPEYTGNGAHFFAREGDPVWRDAARAYATDRELDRVRNHLAWLAPAPADNTWAIAVRQDLAAAIGGPSLENLARYAARGGRIILAASAEFVESAGALPAIERAYGFRLGQDQLLVLPGGDTAATIRAAAEAISGVNAGMAYGSDGALAVLHLVLLADDKHAEIVYQPCPVLRQAVLDRYPGISALLDPVFRSLTLATLQRLNAEIAVDGRDPRDVATEYLAAQGVLK